MRRTLRKPALTTFIVTALLHEPTVRASINLLVNLHIMLRIAFDILRHDIATNFPAFVGRVIIVLNQIRDFVDKQLERTMLALSPLMQRIAIAGLSALTGWLRESPRYLCEFNEWLVTTGGGITSMIGSEELDDSLEQLFLSGEQVARLCDLVRGGLAEK